MDLRLGSQFATGAGKWRTGPGPSALLVLRHPRWVGPESGTAGRAEAAGGSSRLCGPGCRGTGGNAR